MTNFQTNLTQNQMPYGYPYSHSVPSKGINEIKTQNNMAGKVADSYDPSENPSSMAKSFLYSLLMSTGFVRLTNWLMKPKTITDTMTQMDSYKQSRLYKIGEKQVQYSCGKIYKVGEDRIDFSCGKLYKVGGNNR